MWEVGFEPTKTLSHRILSPAPLTTRELPLTIMKINHLLNLFRTRNYQSIFSIMSSTFLVTS